MNRGVQLFARGQAYRDNYESIFRKEVANKEEELVRQTRTGGKDTINTRGSA